MVQSQMKPGYETGMGEAGPGSHARRVAIVEKHVARHAPALALRHVELGPRYDHAVLGARDPAPGLHRERRVPSGGSTCEPSVGRAPLPKSRSERSGEECGDAHHSVRVS